MDFQPNNRGEDYTGDVASKLRFRGGAIPTGSCAPSGTQRNATAIIVPRFRSGVTLGALNRGPNSRNARDREVPGESIAIYRYLAAFTSPSLGLF